MISKIAKFSESLPEAGNMKELTQENKLNLFKKNLNMTQNKLDDDNLHYLVREPSMRTKNVFGQKYIDFLNYMEGSSHKIVVDSYCYDGLLVIDGSFKVKVNYDERIEITGGSKTIKTIEPLI